MVGAAWTVDTQPMSAPTSDPSGPAIVSATGLTKSWGSHQVFSDLTVDILPGVTGLLGSNGSGKTTLFGMMLGLHHPDGGTLSVLGADPAHAGPDLRERIGYAPEHHDLPGDVLAHDFVRHIAQVHGLPTREATTRSSDALWLVGLGEERARPIETMSTGQRQRVKLAQAIAHSPSLVLLDEPTDGLDPVQRDDMLALIRRIGSEFGIDVILSTHLLEEVERIADNVVIISDGTVVASGPLKDLQGGGGGMTVAVTDRHDELLAAFLRAGLDATRSGDQLTVAATHTPDVLSAMVRDALVQVGAPLRRLSARESSLEDVFLQQVASP